jgi:hypothetical protein
VAVNVEPTKYGGRGTWRRPELMKLRSLHAEFDLCSSEYVVIVEEFVELDESEA